MRESESPQFPRVRWLVNSIVYAGLPFLLLSFGLGGGRAETGLTAQALKLQEWFGPLVTHKVLADTVRAAKILEIDKAEPGTLLSMAAAKSGGWMVFIRKDHRFPTLGFRELCRRFNLDFGHGGMLLFLYTVGLPLLIGVLAGLDWLKEKQARLRQGMQEDARRVLTAFDHRFPRFDRESSNRSSGYFPAAVGMLPIRKRRPLRSSRRWWPTTLPSRWTCSITGDIRVIGKLDTFPEDRAVIRQKPAWLHEWRGFGV